MVASTASSGNDKLAAKAALHRRTRVAVIAARGICWYGGCAFVQAILFLVKGILLALEPQAEAEVTIAVVFFLNAVHMFFYSEEESSVHCKVDDPTLHTFDYVVSRVALSRMAPLGRRARRPTDDHAGPKFTSQIYELHISEVATACVHMQVPAIPST